MMPMNRLKSKIKSKVMGMAFIIIKPFIVPIIILLIFILIISSITDILYIAFDNDDKVDMKKELSYYNTEYDKGKDKEAATQSLKEGGVSE